MGHPTSHSIPNATPTGNRQRPNLRAPLPSGDSKKATTCGSVVVDMRGLCLHIWGEPGQSREPHFPSEQQVVGKLLGAHLTRGPETGSGNKRRLVLEAPGTGSENRLPACSNTGLLDKQLSCGLAFQPWGRAQLWGRVLQLINGPL